MTFKELTDKYPLLMVHDSHEHMVRADQSAAHEIWHNIISFGGYSFASHIHEYLYDDGTSKLFIMYSSLPKDQFLSYIDDESFMGDFVRNLNKLYPDLDYYLGNVTRQLDTDENLARFDAVIETIRKLPKPSAPVKSLKEESSVE